MILTAARRLGGRALAATVALASGGALALPVLLGSAAPASAATPAAAVPSGGSQATVSADVLPTVQINGVVWAQVVVGNTVYVTGKFTSARPAGTAAGTNETPRSNILAYDITTGNLITSWAPTLNSQGLAISASADGKQIYVAGDFTKVNGVTHNHFVALDAATGVASTTFSPTLNNRVGAIAVSGSTVYLGGAFTAANGTARGRLAAYDASNGALLPWAPTADDTVGALAAPSSVSEVVVGGHFAAVNGAQHRGLAAVDAVTGASLPFAAESTVYGYGKDAAIYSLTTDGTTVYGTGYHYNSGTGNLEGSFSAAANGGALTWVADCHGDSYDSAPIGGVLYVVSHAYDCSSLGGLPYPATSSRTRNFAQAFTTAPTGKTYSGGTFAGQGQPEILPWMPNLHEGTYTGQSQAAWSVKGNSQYISLGGEFPGIGTTAQQGLARMAIRSIAPNKVGPDATTFTDLKPTLTALGGGVVRASSKASFDLDDRTLTYTLTRGTGKTATVVATTTADSTYWNRPTVTLKDPSAPSGDQTYTVSATDPWGNVLTSAKATVTVTAPTSTAYRDAVLADGATHYWRLDQPSGTTGYDLAGTADLTLDASDTSGAAGGTGDGDTATTFTGAVGTPAATTAAEASTAALTEEAWIQTTSTSGGTILALGDNSTSTSPGHDRQLYMLNDGRISVGIWNGSSVVTATSTKSYNDGQFHDVAATLGADGLQLLVDGVRVGRAASATFAYSHTGYWKVGGENLGGWPDQPTSGSLAGTIDDVAVYPTALSQARLQAHVAASGRTVANVAPTASFTSSAVGAAATFDASASTDDDGTIASYAWDFGDGATGTGVTPSHTYAAAGSHQVTLTVTDDKGATGTTVHTVSTTTVPTDAYGAAVIKSSPSFFWRFEESTGTSVADTSANAVSGSVQGGTTLGAPGVGGSKGALFDGSTGQVVSTAAVSNPTTYSTELWFTTTTTHGGKLIGFGNQTSGTSNNYDRHVYMLNDGRLDFGTYDGNVNVVTSPKSYNDGAWHHLVATQGPSGMVLYVDGAAVASNDVTTASNYTGYWRVGGDNLNGWSNQPASASFAGTIDDVAVYPTALDAATVSAHYSAQGTDPAPAPVNQAPAAAFTSTAKDLTGSFDASSSTDADGTVAGYGWDFGDGTTGTGATPTHTYTTAGTYHVTLTVTDDKGATGTTTHDITVTAPAPVTPPAPTALAQDSFARTVTNGLGTADVGGAWTTTGSASNFSVGSGAATFRTGTAGAGISGTLAGVSATATDTKVTFSLDKLASGSGVYVSLFGRKSGTSGYSVKTVVSASGAVSVSLVKTVSGTDTALKTVAVSGLTVTPGQQVNVRLLVTGTSPTTISAKVWAAGTTEPTAWQATTTDSTAGLQAAGGVGLMAYLSGSATNAPITTSFTGLTATAPTGA